MTPTNRASVIGAVRLRAHQPHLVTAASPAAVENSYHLTPLDESSTRVRGGVDLPNSKKNDKAPPGPRSWHGLLKVRQKQFHEHEGHLPHTQGK